MLRFVLPDLVDWHDAGMIEAGPGLGFGIKPLDVRLARERPARIILSATIRLRLI
jgi:hypothetical protein